MDKHRSPVRSPDQPGVVIHAFNPSTREAKAVRSESEASLVNKVSYRAARVTQKNLVLKNKMTTTKRLDE